MAVSRKQQQNIVMVGGIIATLIGAYVIFGLLQPKQSVSLGQNLDQTGVEISLIKDRTSSAAPEHSWVNQSKVAIDGIEKQVENLANSLEAQRLEAERVQTKLVEDNTEIVEQLMLKIGELEDKLTEAEERNTTASRNQSFDQQYADTGSEFIERRSGQKVKPLAPKAQPSAHGATSETTASANTAQPFVQSFKLADLSKDKEGTKPRNTLDSYVPAGSYAEAVVLSGADAATNVVDRENPLPVLLRITGPAITANKKKIHFIKGCTVQGSAIGDLSSERVHVRLISMTCISGANEVIETKVAGHIVGSGKSGVRGHVTSREGGLITNAAIAGALNGLAGAVSGPTSANAATDLQSIATNAATAAGVGGVEEAATTLSEYYINRAEQYQPVVSLYGNTKVEVVFTNGVSLK